MKYQDGACQIECNKMDPSDLSNAHLCNAFPAVQQFLSFETASRWLPHQHQGNSFAFIFDVQLSLGFKTNKFDI